MPKCEECLHYCICEIMHDQYGISKIYPSQCGYYCPTADVAPRADVAREIVEDVKTTLLDYHLQENMKYLQSLFNTKKQFDIKTQRYRAATDAIKFALKTLDEIEKKYAEDGK